MSVYDFAGRAAVVTGGAQGIGRAVAERILASKGSVSISDTDRDLLKKAVAELGLPDRVQGVDADIADLASVERAAASTKERFGRIDVLINNAAIVGPNATTWEYPPEAFRDVVNVGLKACSKTSRARIPAR